MEIKGKTPLTIERETELMRRYIVNRDLGARNELIEANMGAALKFASPYCRRNPELSEDLKACSLMGLCEAVDHFKINGGRKFCSYACFWCRKRMLELIQQKIHNSSEIQYEDLGSVAAPDSESWEFGDDDNVHSR